MLEQDMYTHIKCYLESVDYSVKAEVLNTDITAIKDDEVLIIEMKKTLNTRLMYQGCKRQRICDYVYLAILKPTNKVLKSSQFKEKIHIIKRLQLGLIFVDLEEESIEIFLGPKNFTLRQNKIKKRKLLKEFDQRTTTFNTGGVTKTKIITAYREQAIMIAYHLTKGPVKLKELKMLTNNPKCASILQKNYYGWFERTERGIYGITQLGRDELLKYDHVLQNILQTNNNMVTTKNFRPSKS